jgi:hypothetical protein
VSWLEKSTPKMMAARGSAADESSVHFIACQREPVDA